MSPGRSPPKRRPLWRLPFESRLAAWGILAVAVAGLAAVIAMGVAASVGRHRCAEACSDRQYVFKEYVPPSRLASRPEACICDKGGAPAQVPMR